MLDTALLSPRRHYLLALSGGRDSVCLLHLLLQQGYRNVHLVHLNHQLRGQDSEADAKFVSDLARELNFPLTLEKADISRLAKEEKKSLESSARSARHQLFVKAARTTGCSRVLLAHHADDQAETCLFNLLRGSAGLKGMEPQNEFQIDRKKLTFLRPLLQTRRAQIDQFISSNNLSYREDGSNTDLAFTRNRIRHQALPLLSQILARDVVPPLTRALATNRANEEIISNLLEVLELRDPQGRLFLPKLRDLPPALQRACLRNYLHEHQIPQISQALLDRALLLISPEGPPALNLPSNFFLRRKNGRLFVD